MRLFSLIFLTISAVLGQGTNSTTTTAAPAPAPSPPGQRTTTTTSAMPTTMTTTAVSQTQSQMTQTSAQTESSSTDSNGSVVPIQTQITGESSKTPSFFQLGTAGVAGIAVVCIAIIFAGIAFLVIRKRNKTKTLNQESILNLEDMSSKPAPAAPGSRAVPLVLSLSQSTIERKAGSPTNKFLYAQRHQHQQYTPSLPQEEVLQGYQDPQEYQYSQHQIDQWNAQTAAGIYTHDQVIDWCEQLRIDGYTEEDIQTWSAQQTIYTQSQIDEWYYNSQQQNRNSYQ